MTTKIENPPRTCPKCQIQFTPSDIQLRHYDYRCPPCKRKLQNAINRAKGDKLKIAARLSYEIHKEKYKAYWKEQRKNPLHLLKRKARGKVATEIKAGRLERKPCRVCGAGKSEAHHHDYNKPLDIDWLCRRCHFAAHSAIISQRGDAMLKARQQAISGE